MLAGLETGMSCQGRISCWIKDVDYVVYCSRPQRICNLVALNLNPGMVCDRTNRWPIYARVQRHASHGEVVLCHFMPPKLDLN